MTTSHFPVDSELELPQEESSHLGDAREVYDALVDRLSRQSVTKRYECYADIPWDDPEYALDPTDPRFEVPATSSLGATDWYRSQPPELRARLGCHMTATFMKTGRQFESVLKQGMLRFAATLPDGAPEYRYCYHEIIEEAHHSLMFQEFVVRSGLEVEGLSKVKQRGARFVAKLGDHFPELFLFFVLGGEDPIDYIQREAMQDESRANMHPLLRTISKIHITEEARHMAFARAYLRLHVPELSAYRRLRLKIGIPGILRNMAPLMMRPSEQLIREYQIPDEVIQEAYTTNTEHQRIAAEALRKVRDLCVELGLAHAPFDRLWKGAHIWA